MSKHKIILKKQHEPEALKFQVIIKEVNGTTTHIITINNNFLDLLSKNHSHEEIVIAVFHFLLDREPKEKILKNFDISIILYYFPNFFSEISSYLSNTKN